MTELFRQLTQLQRRRMRGRKAAPTSLTALHSLLSLPVQVIVAPAGGHPHIKKLGYDLLALAAVSDAESDKMLQLMRVRLAPGSCVLLEQAVGGFSVSISPFSLLSTKRRRRANSDCRQAGFSHPSAARRRSACVEPWRVTHTSHEQQTVD